MMSELQAYGATENVSKVGLLFRQSHAFYVKCLITNAELFENNSALQYLFLKENELPVTKHSLVMRISLQRRPLLKNGS